MRPLALCILYFGLIAMPVFCSGENSLFFNVPRVESLPIKNVIAVGALRLTPFASEVAKTPTTRTALFLKTKKYTRIEAEESTGVFYGIQSLTTSLPPHFWKTPAESLQMTEIEWNDVLRFSFRQSLLISHPLKHFFGKCRELPVLNSLKIIRDSFIEYELRSFALS